MLTERWHRAEALFHAALEREPGVRTAFLVAACGDDSELRQEVEILVSKDECAGSFFESPLLAASDDVPRSRETLVGQQFGSYRIICSLGSGGMGEVYRAHDAKLARDVAIKTLPTQFAQDPVWLAHLRREAHTLASLNHPNIAAIYGLEDGGGLDCLVMELVEGEVLRGPLPIVTALERADQVAGALEAAHASGIIHRDLKPTNIKVTPQGRVKVLDFGLAKAVHGQDGSADNAFSASTGYESIAGNIAGTPGYMSPEQCRGGDVDQRTDVWSFGCLLFELLAGKRAFAIETQSATSASPSLCEPDWGALPAKTPSKIRKLLRRCLETDINQRLANMAEVRRTIESVQHRQNRRLIAALVGTGMLMIGIGSSPWMRSPRHPLDRSSWVQLTKFPDSVSQPQLSPDGRMITFVRSPRTDPAVGQIYVKHLPDGEAIQLTHDDLRKGAPAFTPDGTAISYSTVDSQFHWDTWTVSVQGGETRRWLRNAGSLSWADRQHMFFSEIMKGPLMGIVAANTDGTGRHSIYTPLNDRAMAERSFPSPDGKWVLVAEVGAYGNWEQCRAIRVDGTVPAKLVGPHGASCTFGAWSPDGKWVYLTSKAGGLFHIWRQRFPEGEPQQVTSGPTEEEGVAMAPDSQSFVTAVSVESSSLWIHDARGERQISVLEGNAAYPKFLPDGKRLCYRIVKAVPRFGTNRDPGELWVVDLASGRSERIAPGLEPLDYDISRDGQQVVMEAPDSEGNPRLWLAALDGRSRPRQIPNVQGRKAIFGPSGEIFFRHVEGASSFLYRVQPDGTGLRKALQQTVLSPSRIPPGEPWIEIWAPLPNNEPPAVQVVPIGGGPPIVIGSNTLLEWSSSRDSVWITAGPVRDGVTYVVPLSHGKILPPIPKGGFRSEEEVASLPGAQRIDAAAAPGPSIGVYAFIRQTTQRNLYRIPVQ